MTRPNFRGLFFLATPNLASNQSDKEQEKSDEADIGNGLGGMECLRVEGEGDGVAALGQDDGAQDVVGAQDFCLLAVDGAAPTGIVDV